MSLHKLTAGDGYQYLIRQTAAADRALEGREALSDYYSEKGEAPGSWAGAALGALGTHPALHPGAQAAAAARAEAAQERGAAPRRGATKRAKDLALVAAGLEAHGNLAPGSMVSAEQMRALFGEGRHPNADEIEARVAALGGDAQTQAHASKLGSKYRTTGPEQREFLIECARAYEAFNRAADLPATAAVPEEERTAIRTRVGRELFTEQHGRPPADARELSGFIARESRPRQQACAGFDLTFSPVKSVSTLWALADRDTAKVIEQAHEAAVRDTIEWLERDVIYTRRGADGARTVDTNGVLAAMFVHRDSRAGDPDLHTHVAIANKVQDPTDGSWLAIDGQVLYKHTVAASERYNTRLETELAARLGVEFEAAENPREQDRVVREVVGVPEELRQRWSARRVAIDAQLKVLTADFQARQGRVPSPKEALALAQQANLETRQAKHEHRSEAEQREQWANEAAETLGSPAAVQALLDNVLNGPATGPSQGPATAGELPAPERIEELAERVLARVESSRATFQRAHVRAEAERIVRTEGLATTLAAALHSGQGEAAVHLVDLVVEDITRHALEGSDTVELDATGVYETVVHAGVEAPGQRVRETIEPAPLRRSDGSSQYETPGARLYTTSRVMSAEAFLLDAAQGHHGRRVSDVDVAVGLLTETANGVDLNVGQQQLVRSLATSGADLQLALAPAGSGKTTAMRALATAWRTSGGNVLALAPSAVAATELGAATGAAAQTLAKVAYDLDEGLTEITDTIDERTMIVVDEAGMASTPDLATVVALARQRGAVVRLIGDDQQLAAIGSGGVLRDIASRVGAETLSEVVRFSTPGEAAGGLALRDGNAAEALGFYLDHSRVRAASHLSGADDVFDAWASARAAGESALMLAADNETVNALNARARHHRLSAPTPIAARGAARGATSVDTDRAVTLRTGLQASAGDTVVTRENSRKLRMTRTDHVKNGDRWTVVQAHPDGALTVRHDQLARIIKLPADYVADNVDLGYATTVHGAQGQTVDRCYALITSAWDRASAYVALTRGRHENTAFVATGGDGDPHTQITPEQVEQPTATETLLRVFERDTTAVSATTAAEQATAPATQLRQLAAIYRDGLGRSAELLTGPETRQRITDQVEDLVPGISTTASWDALLQHLCVLHLEHAATTRAAGTDASADPADISAAVDAFTAALAQGPLENTKLAAAAEALASRVAGRNDGADGADDVVKTGVGGSAPARDLAAVMMWRLVPERRSQHNPGPLPWLQPIAAVIAADDTYGPWLATRATQLRDVEHQVREDATSWSLATAPPWAQPFLAQAAQTDGADQLTETGALVGLVADLAVWRAAHGIEDEDLRPAGPAPTSRLDRAHHGRLQRRVKDAGIDAAASAAATHWSTAVQVLLDSHPALAHLTNDTWWPVLAARLDELASGGLDLDHPDVIAALTALAAEEPTHAPTFADADSSESLVTDPDDVDVDEATDSTESPSSTTAPAAPTAPAASAEPAVDRERIVQMHAAAAAFYAEQVETSWVGDYLRGRGLGDLLDAGRCGYAPKGPRVLLEHLTARGYTAEELLAAGLATQGRHGLVDRFRDRMLFTIHDLDQDGDAVPVGFAGRAPEGSIAPKYLNTPTTAAFQKGHVLYGLAENAELLRAGAIPVIVEGQADAEAVTLASGGTHVGLAPGGTALTPDQVAALAGVVDLTTTPVVVATDNDAAGIKAAGTAWTLLLQAGATNPRGLNLTHNDPADVVRYDGNQALVEALGQTPPLVASIVATRLEQWKPVLDHLDGRLGAVRAIAADVAQASPEQQVHATTLVQIAVDLDADIIIDEFDRARGAEPVDPEDDQTDPDEVDQVDDVVADTDEVLRDDQLVEQLLAQALARPLPDEHAAAALWSRLSPYAARTTAAGAGADRQLLEAGLEVDQAAQVMSTNAWPAIVDRVQSDLREGRHATLTTAAAQLAQDAERGQPYASVEAYSAALLGHLDQTDPADPADQSGDTAPSGESARERLLARTRATREETRARLERQQRERKQRAEERRTEPRPGDGPVPRL
jgi:DNA primase catalytic core